MEPRGLTRTENPSLPPREALRRPREAPNRLQEAPRSPLGGRRVFKRPPTKAPRGKNPCLGIGF
eukprot:7728884-Pyramimonas_sp.AAC.1